MVLRIAQRTHDSGTMDGMRWMFAKTMLLSAKCDDEGEATISATSLGRTTFGLTQSNQREGRVCGASRDTYLVLLVVRGYHDY